MKPIREHLGSFLNHLKTLNYHPTTIDNMQRRINYFLDWFGNRGYSEAIELTTEVLEKYQLYCYRLKKKDNTSLSAREQYCRLSNVVVFCRWLYKKGEMIHDPTQRIRYPKTPRTLPNNILTIEEVKKIIAVPNIKTEIGLRDRAIIELLFATGIRRSELVAIKCTDLNLTEKTVYIHGGKNFKDRLLPISDRAAHWLRQYQMQRPEGELFFLAAKYHGGTPLNKVGLGTRLRKIIRKANIGKQGSCHIFRHTMASMMLDNGAELRYIQEMLGHSSLNATQLYTRVAIDQLKAVHDKTHPGNTVTHRPLVP